MECDILRTYFNLGEFVDIFVARAVFFFLEELGHAPHLPHCGAAMIPQVVSTCSEQAGIAVWSVRLGTAIEVVNISYRI